MGWSIQIDLDEAEPLATNSGWGDMCRWIGELAGCPGLRQLARHGWAGDAGALADELKGALEAHAPESADTLSTARNMLRLLSKRRAAEVVSVTDGLAP